MNEKTQKIPRLRFPEFTYAWEQQPLKNLVARVSQTGQNNGLPNVEYEDVVSGEGRLNKNIYEKSNDKKGIQFQAGDVLFGKLRPYLQNWLNPDFSGLAVGDWWVLRSETLESTYLYALIQSDTFQFAANLSAGSKMPRSDWNIVSNTEFFIPQKEEQQKLGTFFRRLDRHITIHQRKLESVKKLKAGLLQKMFPKNGEVFPEIRFPEFTYAWEQKTLGDVGKVEMCRRIFKEQTQPTGDIPFFKIGTFGQEPDAFISRELFEEYRNKYPYPKKGDILISAAGTIGRTVEFTGEDAYFQDSNIVWLRFDENQITSTFLNVSYQNIKWGLEGSTIKRLYNSDLLSTKISIPTLEEQQKLGQFFRRLDRHITIHQRKLENLKKLKKALLQQMFV